MSKHIRKTEPQDTLVGLLVSYAELKPFLVEAELRGRLWTFEKAVSHWDSGVDTITHFPTDEDIFRLHEHMFKNVFAWAGTPRTEDKGPGGIIHVPYFNVRSELKYRFENVRSWVIGQDIEAIDLDFISEVIAQVHHHFEFVHPFTDTNGRTGRTLDHYILWFTLGIVGTDLESSPQIEYFPTEDFEKQYATALSAADNYDLSLLIAYYKDRVGAALAEIEDL